MSPVQKHPWEETDNNDHHILKVYEQNKFHARRMR